MRKLNVNRLKTKEMVKFTQDEI